MASVFILGILGAGLYFLIRLRAFFIFHPVSSLRLFWKNQKTGKRESRATLSLALAGTLGVGNVTGVAFCLLRGGPGSAFWMLFSSVFAAALKYAESVVTVCEREKSGRKEGGMPFVIRASWHFGGSFSIVYALLCLGTAFCLGGALQSRAITETATALFRFPVIFLSFSITALAFFLIRGGKKKIMRASEILVPLATVLYTLLCFGVILKNRSAIGSVLILIFTDAFRVRSALFGIGGFAFIGETVKRAYAGISAGLLSNESGAGTSTLAHGGNLSSSPTSEGMLGTFEILVDTVFLCTLTAVTLLCGGYLSTSDTAMDLIQKTFAGTFGVAFRFPFMLSVFIFALATVICWYSYGEICRAFVFGKKGKNLYCYAFLLSVFIGGWIPTELCIPVCDTFLFFLSLFSISTVVKNADTVVCESEKDGYVKFQKNKKIS